MPEPIRVILADDHAVVRKGIREYLEMDDTLTVVAEAASGDEALKLIRELKPDVAVLDIEMPGQSGIDVTRAARAARLPVGVLLLTAFDDEPYVRAALQSGANGYVLKTAEAQDILEAIRAVYDGKSAIDPGIMRRLLTQMGRADSPEAPLEPLSERELEVLRLTAKGQTNKAIGAELGISDRTVQGHLAKIYDKLHAASRTEAVMRAVTLGLIPPILDESAAE